MLPGRRVPGYVTNPETGEPRNYRLNGILVFAIAVTVYGASPATSTTWARDSFRCQSPWYSGTSPIPGPGPTWSSSSGCSPSVNVMTTGSAPRNTEPTNGQSIRHGSNIELFPGSIEKDDINARLVAKTVSGERIGGGCDRRRLGMPAGDPPVRAAHRPSPFACGAGADAPARPGDPAHRERPTRRP